jgi:gamma-glutamyltranspeptidase/glutathione hydrolase
VQRDLARTLERIASSGEAGFYRGQTAEALVKAMKGSGLLSLEDLASYTAVEREPLRFRYRGLDVEVAPPPSAGGVAVEQMLLARELLHTFDKPRASAEELHELVEIARRVHPTRRFDVVDPDSVDGYDLAAKARQWRDVATLLKGAPPIDPGHATLSKDVHPLYEAAMRELEHTTHYSVSDAEGNVVSCTTTLSAGFGARFVAAGTGVVLNNSLAAFGTAGMDVLAPRRRMTSSMSPTLVSDGSRVVLALGSPGGDTIPNTVVQILRNVVDYGLTIDEAIEAPRIHHGFVPDEIRYERLRPIDPSVRKKLEAMGHRFSKKTIPIGDANDLLIDDRTSYGHADEREGGLALGVHP